MRAAVVGVGEAGPGAGVPPGIDAAPLRRMDRYGRNGYLAGGLALRAAGRKPGGATDPRAGIVFGTAFGCRDSITQHAALLASASTVEEMRPAVFVQTVFNSVNGELAIAWGLGGLAETLVSGRCAGLEALLLAAGHVDEGTADLVLAGAAEGLNEAMERAWASDRRRHAHGVPLSERGAALALAPGRSAPGAPLVVGGLSFFEPDPREAVRRAVESLPRFGVAPSAVVPGSPDLEGILAGSGFAPAPEEESFAAGGLLAAIRVLGAIRAGKLARGGVLVRDPEGPTALALFAAAPD